MQHVDEEPPNHRVRDDEFRIGGTDHRSYGSSGTDHDLSCFSEGVRGVEQDFTGWHEQVDNVRTHIRNEQE